MLAFRVSFRMKHPDCAGVFKRALALSKKYKDTYPQPLPFLFHSYNRQSLKMGGALVGRGQGVRYNSCKYRDPGIGFGMAILRSLIYG